MFAKKISYIALIFLFFVGVVSCGEEEYNEEGRLNEPEDVLTAEVLDSQNGKGELRGFAISKPINYKNLQIFAINGTATAENISYVTLKMAMENKWVKIIETSNVNELEISNLSDKVIFINAGDIVKGGKQDRTLTYDMIIGPNSKHEKISSFCVESQRWSKRDGESAQAFGSNTKMLTSRKLKIASKKENNQQKVWESVTDQTEKLNYNVSKYADKNVDVKSQHSQSSLELALDNKELNVMREEYKKQFINLIDEETIGFAYAINGELYTVDIYNNKKLFGYLYEKLLDAAIVEAIAELDTKKSDYEYLERPGFLMLFEKIEKVEEAIKDLNGRTRWLTKEESDKMIFISQDRKNDLIWVHQNIIIKDTSEVVGAISMPIQQINFNDNRVLNIDSQ